MSEDVRKNDKNEDDENEDEEPMSKVWKSTAIEKASENDLTPRRDEVPLKKATEEQ